MFSGNVLESVEKISGRKLADLPTYRMRARKKMTRNLILDILGPLFTMGAAMYVGRLAGGYFGIRAGFWIGLLAGFLGGFLAAWMVRSVWGRLSGIIA